MRAFLVFFALAGLGCRAPDGTPTATPWSNQAPVDRMVLQESWDLSAVQPRPEAFLGLSVGDESVLLHSREWVCHAPMQWGAIRPSELACTVFERQPLYAAQEAEGQILVEGDPIQLRLVGRGMPLPEGTGEPVSAVTSARSEVWLVSSDQRLHHGTSASLREGRWEQSDEPRPGLRGITRRDDQNFLLIDNQLCRADGHCLDVPVEAADVTLISRTLWILEQGVPRLHRARLPEEF